MANAITLAKTFIPILDKIYKQASLTSVLDGNPELVRQGASYNEMIIPKISKMSSLKPSTFRTNTLKLNSLKPSSPRLLTQKRKEERRYGRL